jgi:hypothetical protein
MNVGMLISKLHLIAGMMCPSFAGGHSLWWSSSIVVAAFTAPFGIRNALSNYCPVETKAFLDWSFFVPMLDVAALSVKAEGMEPFNTPSFSLLVL